VRETHGARCTASRALFYPVNVSDAIALEPGLPLPAEKRRPIRVRAVLIALVASLLSAWLPAVLALVVLRFVNPPTTAVQLQRRVQAWVHGKPYTKRREFVPLSEISPAMQHAVIAAEDARFYQHHGFDWEAIQLAAEHDMDGGRIRGGSTITQQLVKNIFFGTRRSLLRKGAESTLVPVAELVLGKQRILELYLNEVEWGPGIYGVEAASRTYYHVPARSVSREEGARLAAILPSPLKRRPERMDHYSGIILERMAQMGW
jgi:monofunctional glycosyltransferase